ncbi:MAG: phosphodiesterase [Clostridiales bacterium]|nr:phosphodiesterase [Clostridiales bacterium]
MKLLIASDIHGSAKWCQLLIDAFKRENADKLVLLGDILYHGPRNPLPDEYNPQRVAELLGQVKEAIICVRGNCDAEVDQLILPFPVLCEYGVISDGITNIYLSHGHREIPPLLPSEVYITGHTHVPVDEFIPFRHLNPGSVSLPKENSKNGYILYENGEFEFKAL